MKKITVFIILISICLTFLCACSEKKPQGREAFYSPSVVSGLFDAYNESAAKNMLKPSADSYAKELAEYSYLTDDGLQTAHMEISSSFRASDGAFSVNVGQNSFVFGGGFEADGYSVRSITDKKALQKTLDIFIKAFCERTDDGDYETATDSIRAAEDDVEVERVTLKLEKKKYGAAFGSALKALKNDAETMRYITDVIGFYCLLHNREESAEETADALFDSIEEAVNASSGQLVWQRYIYNGSSVAARLKFGENVIRYICAEATSYTELEFSAKVGGKELTLAYEARRTGMSDTYNIRISNGNEITYFDGTAESAYKSGNIGFELRAAKDANVINGFKLDTSFNGEKQLTYKGSGNIVRCGVKKTFSYELVFDTAENISIGSAQNGDISLYEAVNKAF